MTDGEKGLTADPGADVAPEDLLVRVWGPSYRRDEAYLAVSIWRLRQKLEANPTTPALIKSTPKGYLFDPCGHLSCTCLSTEMPPLRTAAPPNLLSFPA